MVWAFVIQSLIKCQGLGAELEGSFARWALSLLSIMTSATRIEAVVFSTRGVWAQGPETQNTKPKPYETRLGNLHTIPYRPDPKENLQTFKKGMKNCFKSPKDTFREKTYKTPRPLRSPSRGHRLDFASRLRLLAFGEEGRGYRFRIRERFFLTTQASRFWAAVEDLRLKLRGLEKMVWGVNQAEGGY